MKNLFVLSIVYLLMADLVECQQLEKMLLGKAIKILARTSIKAKDKKKVAYGIGAVKKATKGTVAGVVGKPLKVIGVILGPLGKPLKVVGSALKTKSVVDKVGAGVLTVKKLSRDSIRYG